VARASASGNLAGERLLSGLRLAARTRPAHPVDPAAPATRRPALGERRFPRQRAPGSTSVVESTVCLDAGGRRSALDDLETAPRPPCYPDAPLPTNPCARARTPAADVPGRAPSGTEPLRGDAQPSRDRPPLRRGIELGRPFPALPSSQPRRPSNRHSRRSEPSGRQTTARPGRARSGDRTFCSSRLLPRCTSGSADPLQYIPVSPRMLGYLRLTETRRSQQAPSGSSAHLRSRRGP